MNNREIFELLVSWFTISLAFSKIGDLIWGFSGYSQFFSNFVVMLFAVGTGFILHELAHKYVAIHFGLHAEFFLWREGLLLALVLALLNSPLIFAAPGAVYIFGRGISIKKNAIISLAGPLTNIVVAVICSLLFALFRPSGFSESVFFGIIFVNFFLAFFNMLPVPPLDGSKVFVWSKLVWFFVIAFSFVCVLFPGIFIFLFGSLFSLF
ncbi:MAG: site-2 protease family protein [Candidatus Diapherotrites archaeon]